MLLRLVGYQPANESLTVGTVILLIGLRDFLFQFSFIKHYVSAASLAVLHKVTIGENHRITALSYYLYDEIVF